MSVTLALMRVKASPSVFWISERNPVISCWNSDRSALLPAVTCSAAACNEVRSIAVDLGEVGSNAAIAQYLGNLNIKWRERQLRYHKYFVPGRLRINSPRMNDFLYKMSCNDSSSTKRCHSRHHNQSKPARRSLDPISCTKGATNIATPLTLPPRDL